MAVYRARRGRSVHFSSASHQWYTPPALLLEWGATWGPFDLDPCADPRSPVWLMVPRHWTIEDDGLLQDWSGRVFCNPPYGRGIGAWTRKATLEVAAGRCEALLLVPARTDTRWWHDALRAGAEPHYLEGRIGFVRPDGSTGPGAAFPSALLVFRNAATVTKEGEADAVALLDGGATVEAVGEQLGITPRTVREYARRAKARAK